MSLNKTRVDCVEARKLIFKAVEEILCSRKRTEAHIPVKFREILAYTQLSYFDVDIGLRFLTRYGLIKKYRAGYFLGDPIKSYFCWRHGYSSIAADLKCSGCNSRLKTTHYKEAGYEHY